MNKAAENYQKGDLVFIKDDDYNALWCKGKWALLMFPDSPCRWKATTLNVPNNSPGYTIGPEYAGKKWTHYSTSQFEDFALREGKLIKIEDK